MAAEYIPWYLYVKKNTLTESQIEALHAAGRLDATTWWLILTTSKTPFSHGFLARHENRKQWWTYVQPTFYLECLQALDGLDNIDVTGSDLPSVKSKTDLRTFLTDFVSKCDWKHVLHYEVLPEWFLQLFGHAKLVTKIPQYWLQVGRWSTLSQGFINKNITKLDLQTVLTYQIVNEEFIRNCAPFLTAETWKLIKTRQSLSEEFTTEFAAFLN